MEPLVRKSWYTLPEAADYLTRNTQGATRVTIADLLQLSAEGQVTLSVQLFRSTPAENGELVLLVEAHTSVSVPYPKCPTETRIDFYDGEDMQGRRLREEVLNDNGPHFLTFQAPTSDTLIGERMELGYMDANLGLLRLWWRLSMSGEEQSPAHLVAAAKAADPALADSPLYFRRTDIDEAPCARITLSALPDDTIVGITGAQLDALLSDDDSGAAGSRLSASSDQMPEDVDLLLAAWRLFWPYASQRDRSTAPLHRDVKQWLMDRDMSAKLADAGATMISPDWNRKGGRR